MLQDRSASHSAYYTSGNFGEFMKYCPFLAIFDEGIDGIKVKGILDKENKDV